MNALENVLKKWKPLYKIELNYINELSTQPPLVFSGKLNITITDNSYKQTSLIIDNPEIIQLDLFIDNYLTELHAKKRNNKITQIGL